MSHGDPDPHALTRLGIIVGIGIIAHEHFERAQELHGGVVRRFPNRNEQDIHLTPAWKKLIDIFYH